MREPLDVKMYFYIDESGDPTILAHGGKNLLSEGKVSMTFMLGYVETANPSAITQPLVKLRESLTSDTYLQGIPSMSSSLKAFHANKDCPEVKERVFRLLREADYCQHRFRFSAFHRR